MYSPLAAATPRSCLCYAAINAAHFPSFRLSPFFSSVVSAIIEPLNGIDMESWKNTPIVLPLLLTFVISIPTLALYRLFFHPLSHFPGPKLAAITRLYEAYYDVIQNGQYTFKIAALHAQYGPIIRISPHELHVSDPSFFEKLYRQDGRWDKYAWSYDAFSAKYSSICTIDHELHRRRRAPLNAFFSKATVSNRQGIIQAHLNKLCDRIQEYDASSRILNLGTVISAFTGDVATEYIIGKSYSNLDRQDFNANMTNVLQSSGAMWRITKHVRFLGPTLKALPMPVVEKIGDDGAKAFFAFLKVPYACICSLTAANDSLGCHADHTKHHVFQTCPARR